MPTRMGHGTVVTASDRETIRQEARFAETRGWVVTVDQWYTLQEADEEEGDEAADRGAAPYRQLADFAQEVLTILHLFAGHRRPGDLQEALEELAPAYGCRVRIISMDLAIDPVKGNLRNPEVVAYWVKKAEKGEVHAAHGGATMFNLECSKVQSAGAGPSTTTLSRTTMGIAGDLAQGPGKGGGGHRAAACHVGHSDGGWKDGRIDLVVTPVSERAPVAVHLGDRRNAELPEGDGGRTSSIWTSACSIWSPRSRLSLRRTSRSASGPRGSASTKNGRTTHCQAETR